MSSRAPAPRSRAPRILLFIVLLIAVAVALLVGAEMAFRQRTASSGNARPQVRYYPHAKLDRAFVRAASYGNLHINSHGFRGPEIAVSKAAGTVRIMTVGASTTFDACIGNDAETWPARLQYWLGELAPGRRFEVINAGVPAMPMLDHIIRLHSELYAFEPDVVIVYAGHGTVVSSDAVSDTSRTPRAARAVTPWDTWLRRHSRLYERTYPLIEKHVQLGEQDWVRAIDNATDRFRRDLTTFTLVSNSMNAEVVMAEIIRVTGNRPPSEFTEAEHAAWRVFATPTEIVYRGYQRFHNVWQEVADSLGGTFIPEDVMDMDSAQYFCARDAIHFNPAGSDAMGRRLAEQLLSRGVVDTTASAAAGRR